jgi:membrane-associated phospholipid phosphatase
LTAIDAAQGMVTIPSFHVVFAVLFAWTFRRERWVYPLAIALNAGVIAATFPVGWHYLTDLAAGGIWAAGTIAVVRRVQGAPAGNAAASDVVAIAGSQGARGHHWDWSFEKHRSRESA